MKIESRKSPNSPTAVSMEVINLGLRQIQFHFIPPISTSQSAEHLGVIPPLSCWWTVTFLVCTVNKAVVCYGRLTEHSSTQALDRHNAGVCENLNRWSLWIYLLCRNNSTTFLSTHVSRAQISVEVPSDLPSELFRLVTGNFLQDENPFLGNMSEIS